MYEKKLSKPREKPVERIEVDSDQHAFRSRIRRSATATVRLEKLSIHRVLDRVHKRVLHQ